MIGLPNRLFSIPPYPPAGLAGGGEGIPPYPPPPGTLTVNYRYMCVLYRTPCRAYYSSSGNLREHLLLAHEGLDVPQVDAGTAA